MLLLANDEAGPGVVEAVRCLKNGKLALDAIEAGIRLVEADPAVRTVGYNSWPNLLGELELDAAVMDGSSLRTGAVGALQGFRHPISVARKVMELLPFEILVGDGAARFAREISAEPGVPVTADAYAGLQQFLDRHAGDSERHDWPETPLIGLATKATDPSLAGAPARQRDTTIFIVRDRTGSLCSGASTSGWAFKYPGRLGDTPLIGAGSYVDSEYGGAACTQTGEMTIRAESARSVVLYLKMGMTLEAAVDEAVADLRRLKDGLIAGVTIHACDPLGNHKVVHARPTGTPDYWTSFGSLGYWFWQPKMAEPELRPVELVSL